MQLDWFEGDRRRTGSTARYEAPTIWDAFVHVLHRDGYDVPAEVLDRDVREPIDRERRAAGR